MAGQLDMTDARTRSEAAEVYEMRRIGRSIGYILDHTDYQSVPEIIQALKAYNAELAVATTEGRSSQVQMELDRIDAVQAEMWDVMETEVWKYDKEGNALERDYDMKVKAAKVVLDCIKQRAALLGLTETDVTQAQAAVLIVGKSQGDYMMGLINAIPAHARPKDTDEVILQLEANPAD